MLNYIFRCYGLYQSFIKSIFQSVIHISGKQIGRGSNQLWIISIVKAGERVGDDTTKVESRICHSSTVDSVREKYRSGANSQVPICATKVEIPKDTKTKKNAKMLFRANDLVIGQLLGLFRKAKYIYKNVSSATNVHHV